MEYISTLEDIVRVTVSAALLCLAVYAFFRALRPMPAKLVTGSLHCPYRQEAAVVTFVERLRIGRLTRSVQSCSLLDTGEGCSELCRLEFSAQAAASRAD